MEPVLAWPRKVVIHFPSGHAYSVILKPIPHCECFCEPEKVCLSQQIQELELLDDYLRRGKRISKDGMIVGCVCAPRHECARPKFWKDAERIP